MAKGNVGNLLQHFVAIRAAHQLFAAHGDVRAETTYVDCHSMAPWEPIQRRGPKYPDFIHALASARAPSDTVAAAFQAAWQVYPEDLPANPVARLYPNTAVLLAEGLPHVRWSMRLHDIEPSPRDLLETWGRQRPWPVAVHGDWNRSPLVRKCQATGPTLVMLDPYKVTVGKPKSSGDLRVDDLRLIAGSLCLNLSRRLDTPEAPPAIMTLFSYADTAPDDIDREVRKCVPGWHVARLKLEAHGGLPNMHYQAWWIASHPVVACEDLDAEWSSWTASLGVEI